MQDVGDDCEKEFCSYLSPYWWTYWIPLVFWLVCVSGVGGTGGRIGIQNRRQVHGLMGHLCFSLTTRQVGYTKRGIGGGTRTVEFPT